MFEQARGMVEVPVRKLPFKLFYGFQNIIGFCILSNHKHPFIFWTSVIWNVHQPFQSVEWNVHQPFLYSSSAFRSIRLFQFLVSPYRKAPEQFQNTWLCNTCDHPFALMGVEWVHHLFYGNVVITCKIGSFLCSLDNLLQKNFEGWRWRLS